MKAKPTIKFIENYGMINNEIKISKIFNEYFFYIVKKLRIFREKVRTTFTENNLSEAEMALKRYKSHASLNAINERMKKLCNFAFSLNFTSRDDTVKELNNLKSKKASEKNKCSYKNCQGNQGKYKYIPFPVSQF